MLTNTSCHRNLLCNLEVQVPHLTYNNNYMEHLQREQEVADEGGVQYCTSIQPVRQYTGTVVSLEPFGAFVFVSASDSSLVWT